MFFISKIKIIVRMEGAQWTTTLPPAASHAGKERLIFQKLKACGKLAGIEKIH